jgi:hypothetical protein
MPHVLLSENVLRSRIAQRLENGQLPVAITTELYAGHGTGRLCCICDQEILSEHVEYEVRDPRDKTSSLCFHIRCHNMWQLESLRRTEPRPACRADLQESSDEQSAAGVSSI